MTLTKACLVFLAVGIAASERANIQFDLALFENAVKYLENEVKADLFINQILCSEMPEQ